MPVSDHSRLLDVSCSRFGSKEQIRHTHTHTHTMFNIVLIIFLHIFIEKRKMSIVKFETKILTLKQKKKGRIKTHLRCLNFVNYFCQKSHWLCLARNKTLTDFQGSEIIDKVLFSLCYIILNISSKIDVDQHFKTLK